MFDELMIHSERLTAKSGTDVALDIRLPWYRSLPLSCVERLEFTVDGAAVPPEKTVLLSDGVPYPAEKLRELSETQWFVLDTKQAVLTLDAPLTPGTHEVALAMQLRVPYRDTNYGVPGIEETYIQFASCRRMLTV